MATHGSVSPFDPEKEEWNAYVERLDYYLVANGIEDDAKKVAILMSNGGPTVYGTIRSLVDAEARKGIKYKDLIAILTAHFDPKPSPIVQRFKFYNRARAKGETIAAYVAALRALAEYCNFGDSLSTMLRDRLVCGVNHEGIQRRLLAEKDLTYKKAHGLAVTLEAAAKGSKDISTTATQQIEPFVNYTKGVNFKQRSGKTTNSSRAKLPDGPQIKTCYRCGDRHLASQCKFRTAECHRCHKTGHIAKVCKSKSEEKSHHSDKKSHHYLEEIPDLPDTEDSSYGLFTLHSETHDPILIHTA